MDLGENEELREALLGPDGDDDLEFYITFPTPTALVTFFPRFSPSGWIQTLDTLPPLANSLINLVT
jgi:hypothetical protein